MKVLLIQPPVEDFYDTDVRLQPIGLAYLKGIIKKYLPDVEIKIHDFHHGYGRQTARIPSELKYLNNYWGILDRSPFCGFSNFFKFGADDETIAEKICQEDPDIVGISSLFSPYFREALRVAELAKANSRAITVIGGSHVSALPESVLRSEFIDYGVMGEGEKPFVEFISAILNGEDPKSKIIPGLCYKWGDQIIKNNPGENYALEEISFPDLSDFSLSSYVIGKKPMTFLITSRSCPHRCSFCSVHNTFGTKYRRRCVDNIMEEIRLRYRQGYRVIDFEDDNLTFFTKDMAELCRRIIAEFPDKDMEFVAMNGISYLSLNRELLELMKSAGFTRLNLSLVTSDQAVLQTTKRPHTTERYLEVVSVAAELGFQITSYQILGLPFESIESMIQTMAFAARLPVLLGASPFYMTPNSPIARQMQYPITEENIVKARLSAMAIETDGFSRDDLYTLFITTRIINFLKSLPIGYAAARALNLRDRNGVFILRHLLATNELLADSPNGFVRLERFRAEVFHRVWVQLEPSLTSRVYSPEMFNEEKFCTSTNSDPVLL